MWNIFICEIKTKKQISVIKFKDLLWFVWTEIDFQRWNILIINEFGVFDITYFDAVTAECKGLEKVSANWSIIFELCSQIPDSNL